MLLAISVAIPIIYKTLANSILFSLSPVCLIRVLTHYKRSGAKRRGVHMQAERSGAIDQSMEDFVHSCGSLLLCNRDTIRLAIEAAPNVIGSFYVK